MSGYFGYSMSNNACVAYDEGKMPLSKWKKADILAALKESNGEDFAMLAKSYTVKILKKAVLECREWHHTSSRYNRTDFYEVKQYDCIDEMLADIKFSADMQPAKNEEKPVPERWHVKYGVWSGSRRHPKLTWVEADGTLDGDRYSAVWFTADDGTRKKVDGNYFKLLSKL